jgi:hypothetical protein
MVMAPSKKPARAKTGAGQVFSLDDLAPRDGMAINGERYGLARSTAFSLREAAQLRRLFRRMGEIEALEDPSADDGRQYRKLAIDLAQMALPDAPRAVLTKLSDEQLKGLILVFFGRSADPTVNPVVKTLRTLGYLQTASTSSSSPDSSAPTPGGQ